MGRRPKPKRVAYELIEVESEPVMYRLLRDQVATYHQHLRYARITLAWCTSWRPDADGRVTLGQCRKATDLDRELAAYDFVILLRRSFWTDDAVSDAQRTALLDHELCHAAVRLNKYGEPVEDERGRKVYRIRKHDIEEFAEIVERHGCYKSDLERFAKVLLERAAKDPFEPCAACRTSPGWVAVAGENRVARCTCWTAFQERRAEALAS